VVDPKDPEELIAPARDGTLRVLRAAQSGGAKRVVLVSSVAAITSGHERENRTFDESDWTDLEKTSYAYAISKTLAERAAWDFIKSADNQSGMELVAVNPSNVFGPPLDGSNFTSVEWFRTLLHAEVPGIPKVQLDFVDVRDLVALFVQAMTAPEAAGKRFIANAASIPLQEFAEILKRNFNGRGFRVPTRVLPDALVRLAARIMPKLRAVANQMDWDYTLSTEQAESTLGWKPRPYKDTILEMAEGLIANGQCVNPGKESQPTAVHNA
jgi:dihydroflavonol-4-reductase